MNVSVMAGKHYERKSITPSKPTAKSGSCAANCKQSCDVSVIIEGSITLSLHCLQNTTDPAFEASYLKY
jgi:hypothetical protein